ncbi:unnamed protein product [Prorocentrum cordatum]|uniref:Cyclic nucleotide-binding domain-containing protein n=1 Tax=Prorocentrum cordatum TaxID=2364126 RepID=A0ABN9X258_9DINO|nr:unnamed protein product [Polarella glacialis]
MPPQQNGGGSSLGDLYSKCVQMVNENKISTKNAFDLPLIDHMDDIVDGFMGGGRAAKGGGAGSSSRASQGRSSKAPASEEEAQEHRFHEASCTIEASARIYACRVDCVHTDTYRVLGGLSAGIEEEDVAEGAEGPGKKRRRICGVNTLERNEATIIQQHFEADEQSDPMFRRMAAAFDAGGAKGLLLSHLPVAEDLSLVFNGDVPMSRAPAAAKDMFSGRGPVPVGALGLGDPDGARSKGAGRGRPRPRPRAAATEVLFGALPAVRLPDALEDCREVVLKGTLTDSTFHAGGPVVHVSAHHVDRPPVDGHPKRESVSGHLRHRCDGAAAEGVFGDGGEAALAKRAQSTRRQSTHQSQRAARDPTVHGGSCTVFVAGEWGRSAQPRAATVAQAPDMVLEDALPAGADDADLPAADDAWANEMSIPGPMDDPMPPTGSQPMSFPAGGAGAGAAALPLADMEPLGGDFRRNTSSSEDVIAFDELFEKFCGGGGAHGFAYFDECWGRQRDPKASVGAIQDAQAQAAAGGEEGVLAVPGDVQPEAGGRERPQKRPLFDLTGLDKPAKTIETEPVHKHQLSDRAAHWQLHKDVPPYMIDRITMPSWPTWSKCDFACLGLRPHLMLKLVKKPQPAGDGPHSFSDLFSTVVVENPDAYPWLVADGKGGKGAKEAFLENRKRPAAMGCGASARAAPKPGDGVVQDKQAVAEPPAEAEPSAVPSVVAQDEKAHTPQDDARAAETATPTSVATKKSVESAGSRKAAMDVEEGEHMKRKSSLKTKVELWFMDGIPELYGVSDTDQLRAELREEGQAAVVAQCLEAGSLRADAAELLAQWLHDAPDAAAREAFVARAVGAMSKIYGGAEEDAQQGKKVCFTESIDASAGAGAPIDRVSTGAVKVKFTMPEDSDPDEDDEPTRGIQRRATGIVTQQQLRAMMMQNYDEDEDEESDEEEQDDEAFEAESKAYAEKQAASRGTAYVRKAVCAEVHEADEDWEPPRHEKTPQQQTRLTAAVGSCFMFAALEPEQMEKVVDAFEEVRLEEGSTVIREGDLVGDSERGLYVLEDGELHVHKGTLGHVFTYSKQGDLFGDLALLYNAPRAATVIATKPSVVWCIDRATFNNLVKNQLRQVKEKRLEFLKSVEVLKTLDPDQLAKLVDVLRERRFGDGVIVIEEGDEGDEFFILEKGACRASKGGEFVMSYEPGTYFGELALLEDQKRAAQISTTMSSSLLSLDRSSFDRVLGPLKPLLMEHADSEYKRSPTGTASNTFNPPP